MELFYFLSNGVLIVSKTRQSAKKTSGVARLERGTQFPAIDSSRQGFPKRGPLCVRHDFRGESRRNAFGNKVLPKNNWAAILSRCHVGFCKPAVAEKILLDEAIDDFLWSFTESGGELFAEHEDRIFPTAQELESVQIDFTHGLPGVNKEGTQSTS
jgi:hypothetical protein